MDQTQQHELDVVNCTFPRLGLQTSRFSLELNDPIRGAKIKLSANEIRLFATRLQSSAPDHFTCERHGCKSFTFGT